MRTPSGAVVARMAVFALAPLGGPLIRKGPGPRLQRREVPDGRLISTGRRPTPRRPGVRLL